MIEPIKPAITPSIPTGKAASEQIAQLQNLLSQLKEAVNRKDKPKMEKLFTDINNLKKTLNIPPDQQEIVDKIFKITNLLTKINYLS